MLNAWDVAMLYVLYTRLRFHFPHFHFGVRIAVQS